MPAVHKEAEQWDVALQGIDYQRSFEQAQIPHRVMKFLYLHWDYTILHRFRDYDDDREANANLFEYNTSSNNRDGLAIKAAGYELLQRDEEKKIMIILSDGKPYDVIVNRPNARNPQPYQGKYAVRDTGFEVRKLRNMGVSVLGVFAGEEKDLATERKFLARILPISGRSRTFPKLSGGISQNNWKLILEIQKEEFWHLSCTQKKDHTQWSFFCVYEGG